LLKNIRMIDPSIHFDRGRFIHTSLYLKKTIK